MPEAPAAGMIERGLCDLSAQLDELFQLCRSETALQPIQAQLEAICDRVLYEERAIRARYMLTPVTAKRPHQGDAQLAGYAGLSVEERATLLAELCRSAQELARTLEEYFRFFRQPRISDFFHRLRFELYDIDRAVAARIAPAARPSDKRASARDGLAAERVRRALSACPLYFILDQSLCEFRDPLRVGLDAVAGGVRMMQLRFKKLPSRELLALARKLKSVCAERDCLLIINDRLDIALLADADGVHVGQEDCNPADIRLQAPGMIIGATAREARSAVEAVRDGASYIGAGSVYPSPTKPGLPIIMLTGLGRIAATVEVPVVGIGGITLENCARVMQSGTAGFCSLGPFRARRSVRNLVGEFRAACKGSSAN